MFPEQSQFIGSGTLEGGVVAVYGVDENVDHGDGLASIDSGNGPRREHADQRVLGSVVGKQSKSGDRSRCRPPQVSEGGYGADSDDPRRRACYHRTMGR